MSKASLYVILARFVTRKISPSLFFLSLSYILYLHLSLFTPFFFGPGSYEFNPSLGLFNVFLSFRRERLGMEAEPRKIEWIPLRQMLSYSNNGPLSLSAAPRGGTFNSKTLTNRIHPSVFHIVGLLRMVLLLQVLMVVVVDLFLHLTDKSLWCWFDLLL